MPEYCCALSQSHIAKGPEIEARHRGAGSWHHHLDLDLALSMMTMLTDTRSVVDVVCVALKAWPVCSVCVVTCSPRHATLSQRGTCICVFVAVFKHGGTRVASL